MTYLLDSSVLIARSVPGHVHYGSSLNWLRRNRFFAVCPITEGALIRYALRSGFGLSSAMQSLEMLSEIEGYEFWPDDLSYMEAQLKGITGHNQVTDAYLAALARRRNGKLATFDAALAATHSDAVLLSVS